MDERMRAVHDRMAALHAEADAERLARHTGADPVENRGNSIRQRAGHALIALGTLLEGRPEDCDGCPDGVMA